MGSGREEETDGKIKTQSTLDAPKRESQSSEWSRVAVTPSELVQPAARLRATSPQWQAEFLESKRVESLLEIRAAWARCPGQGPHPVGGNTPWWGRGGEGRGAGRVSALNTEFSVGLVQYSLSCELPVTSRCYSTPGLVLGSQRHGRGGGGGVFLRPPDWKDWHCLQNQPPPWKLL